MPSKGRPGDKAWVDALYHSIVFVRDHPDQPGECEKAFFQDWNSAIQSHVAGQFRGYRRRMELARWQASGDNEKKARYIRSHRSYERFKMIVDDCVTAFTTIVEKHRGIRQSDLTEIEDDTNQSVTDSDEPDSQRWN